MTKTNKSIAPTLGPKATEGLIEEFSNCESVREDDKLSYRAIHAKPGGIPFWIYRIEGIDLCGGHGSVPLVLSLGRHGLTHEHFAQEFPDDEFYGYAPAATYEGGRIFWTGTRAACRALLDALEYEASQSAELAQAFQDDDPDIGGIEAVLFEWPQGNVASLTVCNASIYQERRSAFEKILSNIAINHPGVIGAMESQSENCYSWDLHQVWEDEVANDGGFVAPRVLLDIYDQDALVRKAYEVAKAEYPEDHTLQGLERALHRREIEQATGVADNPTGGPRLRV